MRILLALLITTTAVLAAADRQPPVLSIKAYANYSDYDGGIAYIQYNVKAYDKIFKKGSGVKSFKIEIDGEKPQHQKTYKWFKGDKIHKGWSILPDDAPQDIPITITAIDKKGNVTCVNFIVERDENLKGRVKIRSISGCDNG